MHVLTSAGYKGAALVATIKENQKTNAITEEHGKDWLNLLAFSVNFLAISCALISSSLLVTEKTVRE